MDLPSLGYHFTNDQVAMNIFVISWPKICWIFVDWLKGILKKYGKFCGKNWSFGINLDRNSAPGRHWKYCRSRSPTARLPLECHTPSSRLPLERHKYLEKILFPSVDAIFDPLSNHIISFVLFLTSDINIHNSYSDSNNFQVTYIT